MWYNSGLVLRRSNYILFLYMHMTIFYWNFGIDFFIKIKKKTADYSNLKMAIIMVLISSMLKE
jgi:hypothetical protein